MKLCKCGRAVKSVCQACKPKSTTNRDVYGTNRWKRLSEAKRKQDPLCEVCIEQGKSTAAEEVHHIQSINDAPWLAFEWSNLMSVCVDCHRSIEKDRQRGG